MKKMMELSIGTKKEKKVIIKHSKSFNAAYDTWEKVSNIYLRIGK